MLMLIPMPQLGMPVSSPKPHNAIAAQNSSQGETALSLAPMN
jgi:hypothetical protein